MMIIVHNGTICHVIDITNYDHISHSKAVLILNFIKVLELAIYGKGC